MWGVGYSIGWVVNRGVGYVIDNDDGITFDIDDGSKFGYSGRQFDDFNYVKPVGSLLDESLE